MSGIKLQFLFGVRIELTLGSLPYPGKSGFPIVSPVSMRAKIPLGIPTFLPMEGIHQTKPTLKNPKFRLKFRQHIKGGFKGINPDRPNGVSQRHTLHLIASQFYMNKANEVSFHEFVS